MVEDNSTLPPDRVERRQHPRIATNLRGELRLGDQVSSVIVKELSAGGVTIETSNSFAYSVPLTLQIEGIGDFETEQVWWSKDYETVPTSAETDREMRETVRVGLKFSETQREICETARKLSAVRRDA